MLAGRFALDAFSPPAVSFALDLWRRITLLRISMDLLLHTCSEALLPRCLPEFRDKHLVRWAALIQFYDHYVGQKKAILTIHIVT
ncbi:hypothetical protein NDU88_001522 [Pleurodeles waltl]|uniref:Uncharacterized protein n=1 Tax=Pleurodeles waltl TaxID=8319 RepID=A0AAV7KT21_PLEWA|nr:hypothetical protein NDU88_001522 [Pleurodeles waltl]